MIDKPAEKRPVEIIPSQTGDVSAIASAGAPFLYFDAAPIYGLYEGMANVSLEVVRRMPGVEPDSVVMDRVIVAHLRMGLQGVRSLRAAMDGILLMATPKPEAPAH